MRDYVKAQKKHERTQRLRKARADSRGPQTNRKKHRKRWTPGSFDPDDWEEIDLPTKERIVSLGETERRKTVEQIALEKPARFKPQRIQSSNGNGHLPKGTETGLVTQVNGSQCRVQVLGQQALCSLRGNLRTQETGFTNPVAVGDQVVVRLHANDQGVVESVLPRRSVLARPYMPDRGKSIDRQQAVVANVDQVLIVASWREPDFWPELVDRYLITARRNDLRAVLCVNKVDLVDDQVELDATLQPYRALGIPVLLTSVRTQVGLERLDQALRGVATVLTGLSGVGKSSLLTTLNPDFALKTREVTSRGLFTGQGRHTTTSAALFQLDNGGMVVDTPGIREFGLVGIAQTELAGWFPEMVPFIGQCTFNDCTHHTEPGCAVLAALADGKISGSRYKSYRLIYGTL